jgi:glycosyltransferase involved in cell wall biosynthesis
MPKVSIVITCYNLGEYLEEALSSALAQTYPDFEVLLVDDGSTDAQTIALLDQLPQHPRLRVLRTANQGVARARNCGISATSGAYILPLDADDRILPGYLARAVPILDQCPEVGFVGCHYRTFGERETEYTPQKYCLPDLLVENVVPISSLFRRVCWEQIGGYAPEVRIEDWDLWLGILEYGHKGYVIPDILFEYRVRANSRHSANQQPQVYQDTWELMYERHNTSYQRYARDIMLEQVKQYSATLEHQNWLADQTVKLRSALEEQKKLIVALQTIAEARADWIAKVEAARDYYVTQSNQWQQAAEQLVLQMNQLQQTQVEHVADLYPKTDSWRQMSWYTRLKRRVSLGKLCPSRNKDIKRNRSEL